MKKEELENVYNKLCEAGHIKYGYIISRHVLGHLFETQNFESWDYIDPLLCFKAYLEQEIGMFCTTQQGDLCIAKINDAPIYSKQRRKRADNLDRRTKKILENIDYKEMSSSARAESMLEKRLLEMKLRHSRLIMREIEYYEISEEDTEED